MAQKWAILGDMKNKDGNEKKEKKELWIFSFQNWALVYFLLFFLVSQLVWQILVYLCALKMGSQQILDLKFKSSYNDFKLIYNSNWVYSQYL